MHPGSQSIGRRGMPYTGRRNKRTRGALEVEARSTPPGTPPYSLRTAGGMRMSSQSVMPQSRRASSVGLCDGRSMVGRLMTENTDQGMQMTEYSKPYVRCMRAVRNRVLWTCPHCWVVCARRGTRKCRANAELTLEKLFGGRSVACDFVVLAQNAFCTRLVAPLQGSLGRRFAASPTVSRLNINPPNSF
jgi:hypothetical protein